MSYVPLRVAQRTVNLAQVTDGSGLFYDVSLKLNLKGVSVSVGGGTGVFPHPTPTGHWWEGSWRLWMGDANPSGFGAFTGSYRTFEIGQSYTYHVHWYAYRAYASGWGVTDEPGGVLSGGGGIFTSGLLFPGVAVGLAGDNDGSFVPDGSLVDESQLYRFAASSAGPNIGDGDGYIDFDFWIDPDGWELGEPPQSGQWVYGEVVTMSGAAGTTAWPYAAGSLIVRVDGVRITNASYTETDNAAGDFTLAWIPDADETVTVDYQGI